MLLLSLSGLMSSPSWWAKSLLKKPAPLVLRRFTRADRNRFFVRIKKMRWLSPYWLICLLAVVALPFDGNAQPSYRVIVLGDDSDPKTIRRTSDIYKRVISEIRRPISQRGFELLDEDIIAVQLGFKYPAGLSKSEILQAVMLANKSSNVNTSSRFLVLMRINVFSETFSFTKQVHARITGDIYDMDNGSFVDAYEIPQVSFPVPLECNDHCLIEQAGAKSRDIAADLGVTLSRQLAVYIERSTRISGLPSVGEAAVAARSFTFVLKNFRANEINEISRALRDPKSGTLRFDLIESTASQRRYQLVTTAQSDRLVEYLSSLLERLNVSEDDSRIGLTGQTINIEKMR